jgi:hypothetical protein
VIGTVERYRDEASARAAMAVLLAEVNSESEKVRMRPFSITLAQLCDHFEQRELTADNAWRSFSTKKTYKAYLTRWILPRWRKYELAEVRTIQVETWLRRLPLAKSSCAKIRNLMSVLFNHACRYELFDRNPISLVRQSAKRRTAPTILTPTEIKAKLNPHRNPCPFIGSLLMPYQHGGNSVPTRSQMTGFLPAGATEDGGRIGGKRSCADMFDRLRKESESRNASGGTRFVIRIRLC